MTPSAQIGLRILGRRYAASRHSEAASRWSTQLPDVAESCVLCAPPRLCYRPVVTIFGRSSIRTWLNSVLSLCAPHWGQRSADDQAPQRGHSLWVRFGTTSLPVHRCRIWTSSNTSREPPTSKSSRRCHQIWRLPGARRNIIDQFQPNWKARRYYAGSRVASTSTAWRHRPLDWEALMTAFCRVPRDTILATHHRRMHFGITADPTAAWTAKQLTEALPGGRHRAI